jgi:hypothetical protein
VQIWIDCPFIPRPIGTRRFYATDFPSHRSNISGDESPNIYIRSIEMNNRNQQTARGPAPAEAPAPNYLNVFTVEEYESNGKTGKRWTKIGAAFPHKEGIGFNIELKAFPVDGRLVALPPDTEDSNRNGK